MRWYCTTTGEESVCSLFWESFWPSHLCTGSSQWLISIKRQTTRFLPKPLLSRSHFCTTNDVWRNKQMETKTISDFYRLQESILFCQLRYTLKNPQGLFRPWQTLKTIFGSIREYRYLGKSRYCRIISRIKQGCVLSHFLFILGIDYILHRCINYRIPIKKEKRIADIEFTYNISLFKSDKRKLTQWLDVVGEKALRFGLKINDSKTKSVSVTGSPLGYRIGF